jgi:pimeloyl-ACP methyl ester carboxylesterase
VPGVEEEVRCGRYEVYENRAAGSGRKISLNVVVLPAKSADKAPDPLVFLAGGGVAPATSYAGFLSRALPNLRQHRDVLLVDQRGTGGSNPLDCELSTESADPEYRDEARFREAVRRCRRELETKADLRYYTTPFAVDDLDDVRAWLGYPRLDFYGASYGTTVAMVYVRQHPERVRVAALQGVLPIDAPLWFEYGRSAQQALVATFAACARQTSCHDAFPDLADEYRALVQRLADEPIRVRVAASNGGEETEVPLDGEILRRFVVRVLTSAERIRKLPLLLHLAFGDDYRPLAREVAALSGGSGIPKGIYFSIVCSEEVTKAAPAAALADAVGSPAELLGARDQQACEEWVRGWLPEGYRIPVRSDLPFLLLAGSIDDVTPPRYADQLARSLPNARRVLLPNRGHNDVDPCVTSLVEAFIAAGNAEGLDTRCLDDTPELTFALRADELAD